MARCSCSGSLCSCLVVAGEGMEVSGSGQANDPYLLSNTGIQGALAVQDSATADLALSGGGTQADPYLLTATARVRLFSDMLDMTPGQTADPGDTIIVQPGGTFDFGPPPVSPPGAVNTRGGIVGTGSVASPIEVAVAGVWGVAPLDTYGADSTLGAPVYVDTNGKLRTQPQQAVAWTSITGKPATFNTTWAQVSGAPSTYPTTWAQVASRPTTFDTTWAQVQGRPTTSTIDGRTIYVNDIAPTAAQGVNGDIWFEY